MAVTIRPAVLTNVRPARNHVKGVRNHAGGQKRLTVGIEIEAPGIAGSFRKNIELFGRKIITPNRRVQPHFTDLGLREDAVQAIEQTVRAPLESIEGFVRVLAAETGQQYLLLVALASTRCIAQEKKMRRRSEEDAAMADFDAGGQVPANR